MWDEEDKDRLAEITSALLNIADALVDANRIHDEGIKELYEIQIDLLTALLYIPRRP